LQIWGIHWHNAPIQRSYDNGHENELGHASGKVLDCKTKFQNPDEDEKTLKKKLEQQIQQRLELRHS